MPRMIPRTVGWATTKRTPSTKSQRCLQVDPAPRALLTRHPARTGDGGYKRSRGRKVSESTAKARATSPSITPEALKIPPTLARRANARAPTGEHSVCGDQRQAVGRHHPPLGTRLGTHASGWLPQQGERLQHERNRKELPEVGDEYQRQHQDGGPRR